MMVVVVRYTCFFTSDGITLLVASDSYRVCIYVFVYVTYDVQLSPTKQM